MICLLNGGRETHKREGSYKLSRGVVVKDLLGTADFDKSLHNYDLKNIEPFTIISAHWNNGLRFIEVVWDGIKKHINELGLTSHIWSSSPLYDNNMKTLRDGWFRTFKEEKELTPENLWEFHNSAGIGDKQIDVVMDRGFVSTQSITQIINTSGETVMIYKDLQNKKITEKTFRNLPRFQN